MRLASGCYRIADNSRLTKHVVAAGGSVRDAGSTPAASTIFYGSISFLIRRDKIGVKANRAGGKNEEKRRPLEVIKVGNEFFTDFRFGGSPSGASLWASESARGESRSRWAAGDDAKSTVFRRAAIHENAPRHRRPRDQDDFQAGAFRDWRTASASRSLKRRPRPRPILLLSPCARNPAPDRKPCQSRHGAQSRTR